ncbi:aminodeoxychorismate lyase [Paenibacillus caui]|uniref:aminodeoxychorismate lyase n=1 Tax=Paenibacillus caui TaxID=2873927 RepID=UPI001CA91980|nr:aminodeoxychorismate lyase [Paenibacillus caui]
MKYIGLNGLIVPEAKAMVSVMDHGFLYGVGLFETFRTYGGVPFLLGRHMARLREGCAEAGITLEIDEHQVNRHVKELFEANGLEDGYIRYTVTAGRADFGLPTADYKSPTVVVYVKPLSSPSEALDVQGKALRVLKTRRNTPEGEVRLKSLHYLNNILAKRELLDYDPEEKVPAEGLMLTREGDLAEGIVSNVFLVSGGSLLTPAVDTGVLPGITREAVIRLARQFGIEVQEGRFGPDQLDQADEIFVTNSIQEIVPITRVYPLDAEPFTVGDGTRGPLTARLLEAYREWTGGYRR